MGDRTEISWTDATWNPTVGCDRVSPGCDHCYAMTMAKRLKAMGQADYQHDGDPRTSGPGFGLTTRPHMLDQPLRWRRPRRIFVNSMSDLFHDGVPDAFVADVFAVMAASPHHTFQILTKRHGRMRSLLRSDGFGDLFDLALRDLMMRGAISQERCAAAPGLPLPNVWLGVSVEDQQWADIRVPALLDTPATVRFLSCEPLLGPLNLRPWLADPPWIDGDVWPPSNARERSFDWVIVGGESGPGARPMHPDWVQRIRDDVLATRPAGHHRDGTPSVALHFKQWGEWVPAERSRATHLLNVSGSLTTMAAGTSSQSYGSGPPTEQDLIDRGHPGWVRIRKVGKKQAGRVLDGRTWDEWPATTVEATP